MAKTQLRTAEEITKIYERHKNMIYRICFAYMKNASDAEDAVQETFFKLISARPFFENEIHEKAWLIRTATNLCKNMLRSWWRKRENLDDHENIRGDNNVEIDETLSVVLGLPDKYKTVVYLYYYEGNNSAEISEILKKPKSTIRNHLHEARKILKEKLGGELYEE